MDWNTLLFLVFPYVTIILAIIVTTYRAIYRPFTISSLSSQMLERRMLYWGSLSFHWGIVFVLIGHLLAIFFPKGMVLWNSVPLRLYLLEFTGVVLALWSLVGLLILLWRRFIERRIRVVTTPMDIVVLLLVLLSIVTGIVVATFYRYGSTWFTGVFTPYVWSILTLRPRPELVAPLPWMVQLHVLNLFILLAVFPFSRLVHIITYPLGYLFRPWQIVVWVRRART
ncbi:MAG: respiratory nitrate reductase subunit gamma [Anaerolineales bacterium]|nr:respiratory nitrate reductase subunit gamma [Anaerolineales bacterium]MCK5429926.1 respiratory nitrate reductase subunit gamma [Anaerolineales bacterium]